MENASKALLIAGSMLLTIIIVGVIVMVWNNMSEIPKTQDQIKEAEQLSAFNKKYESYAKNGIRGTDVATVVNMAHSHNEKNPESFINVKITIKDEIVAVIDHYEDNDNDGKVSKTGSNTKTIMNDTSYDLKESGINTLKTIMRLSTETAKDTYYVRKGNDFDPDSNPPIEKPDNPLNYYVMQNPYSIFKRKKFNCSIINYNNGRVAEITIVEQ